MNKILRRSGAALACMVTMISAVFVPTSSAEPNDDSGAEPTRTEYTPPRPTDPRPSPPPNEELITPLPVFVPTAWDWEPRFPFPFDKTREDVTDADIDAERELCQWYNAQYDALAAQIDRLQFNRIQQNGPGVRIGSGTDWDYTYNNVQQQVDIVTANIDQVVGFLAPRVQGFTQRQDFAGDFYFPLYQAENFYLMWQHLYNVGNGIKAHQPDWFSGPSVQGLHRAGSHINRSHVCR